MGVQSQQGFLSHNSEMFDMILGYKRLFRDTMKFVKTVLRETNCETPDRVIQQITLRLNKIAPQHGIIDQFSSLRTNYSVPEPTYEYEFCLAMQIFAKQYERAHSKSRVRGHPFITFAKFSVF